MSSFHLYHRSKQEVESVRKSSTNAAAGAALRGRFSAKTGDTSVSVNVTSHPRGNTKTHFQETVSLL